MEVATRTNDVQQSSTSPVEMGVHSSTDTAITDAQQSTVPPETDICNLIEAALAEPQKTTIHLEIVQQSECKSTEAVDSEQSNTPQEMVGHRSIEGTVNEVRQGIAALDTGSLTSEMEAQHDTPDLRISDRSTEVATGIQPSTTPAETWVHNYSTIEAANTEAADSSTAVQQSPTNSSVAAEMNSPAVQESEIRSEADQPGASPNNDQIVP